MPINTVIRERRKELGLTQEQVAEYLGISAPAVNKWEKGSTFPDVTLAPALARLLKVDLNTLFCFHETLTQQEIINFQNETAKEIETNGIDAGFLMAEEKIQEYPNCGELTEGMANLLMGSLIMADMTGEEKGSYLPRVRALYERAMHCDDEKVRSRAGYMMVSQYLKSEEYEKAQEIIDQLPEPEILDKHLLQADIWKNQGKPEEAAKLLERRILQYSNNILGMFCGLTEIEMEAGNEEIAEEIARKAKEIAAAFDMWGYSGLIGLQSLALKKKDVQKSLELLEKMLEATRKPWVVNRSPLYHYLYPESEASAAIAEKILPPLLAELESSPEYDFLRPYKEFHELIEKYRKAC